MWISNPLIQLQPLNADSCVLSTCPWGYLLLPVPFVWPAELCCPLAQGSRDTQAEASYYPHPKDDPLPHLQPPSFTIISPWRPSAHHFLVSFRLLLTLVGVVSCSPLQPSLAVWEVMEKRPGGEEPTLCLFRSLLRTRPHPSVLKLRGLVATQIPQTSGELGEEQVEPVR